MALTDLLGSALRGAALGLAMYVSSCGGSSPSMGCQRDTDCYAPRVCMEGYCEDRNGGGEENNNGNSTCGNSPLVGKYLWGVDDCQGGTIHPFDTSCHGTLEVDDPAGTFDVDIEYHGTTLYLSSNHININNGHQTIELRRTLTESDLVDNGRPGSDCGGLSDLSQLNFYQCLLSQVQRFYVAFTAENGKQCLEYVSLFEIRDEPWPGTARCREILPDETPAECSALYKEN